jgi:hypothetical protein
MRCQPLTAHGQAYVDLHRAASLVRLHAVDDRSRAFLEASSEDLGIASHVRYSSMRLLVRHRRDRGDEFGAAKVLSKLEHATQHDSDPAQASIFLDLAMLDQAVTEASGARARAALVVFREHFPAIVDELLAVRDDPAFVARAFPYERVSTVPLVAAAFVSPGDRSPAASTSPPLPLAHATLAPARLSSQEAMCLPFGPELGLKTSSVTRPTTT